MDVGRFLDVLQTFAFPVSMKREVGWHLWLQGKPVHAALLDENGGELTQNKIKAFQNFVRARLVPTKLAEGYKLHSGNHGVGFGRHS